MSTPPYAAAREGVSGRPTDNPDASLWGPSTTTHEGAAAHNVDGIPRELEPGVAVTGEPSSEPAHNVDGSFVEVAVAVLYARGGEAVSSIQGTRATFTGTCEGI